ncbi:MAG: MmoB/DmpM family protein [Acidimicrobiia bacterium]
MTAEVAQPGGRGVPESLVGMELIPGEDADAVAAAASDVNSEVKVDHQPHVTVVEAPGRLEIDPARVRQHLGRDWGADDLQVIMASYFGFISRWEEDGIVLEWMRASGE